MNSSKHQKKEKNFSSFFRFSETLLFVLDVYYIVCSFKKISIKAFDVTF